METVSRKLGDPVDDWTAHWIRMTLENLRSNGHRDLDNPHQFLRFASQFAGLSRAQLFQDVWALWEAGGEVGRVLR